MRVHATSFMNREACLILKGKQRIHRWIASVQEDRIITYPVDAPHAASASNDPNGREVYRYAQLMDIVEVEAPAAGRR
jgi:hypothetical protein